MTNEPAAIRKLPNYKRERSPRGTIEAYSMPVTECGCWIWLGATNSQGYGSVHIKGKQVKAHRLSWTAFKGTIPQNSLVLHKCDTPACVNPDHLFLGNAVDNSLDMLNKGRGNKAKGDSNGFAKMTPYAVRMARAYAFTAAELAARFGVSESTIERVRSRERWSHIDD
jgi:hypothetical protein